MNSVDRPDFDAPSLREALAAGSEADIDELAFGVIGFDATGRVRLYNLRESRFSGLPRSRVLGHGLFTGVAPCLDNPLVAGRFQDAQARGVTLDATVDHVLTWHMAPTPVRLRLLSAPDEPLRFVIVQHRGGATAGG